MAVTIASLVASHREAASNIHETIARVYQRIEEVADPAIFIHLRPERDVHVEADRLSEAMSARQPLLGIPVAVKDNIDVAGLPTTAGCPAFSYVAEVDATVVARLRVTSPQ